MNWSACSTRHISRWQTRLFIGASAAAFLLFIPARARALDTLCDSSFENCRTPLLTYIQNETVEIDVGMWFMEDDRYASAIISRKQAGVRVRILMDPRADSQHPSNQTELDELSTAGIPMRKRVATGIEHWKIMLFDSQNVMYFGSANFSAEAFVPTDPYKNYVDETVYFTDNPSLVNSFRTKFDDAWMDTTNYANYANAPNSSLVRSYATFTIDPELNIPPGQDFINRTVTNLNAETTKIDVMMYRIADDRATNAAINAFTRGVPMRLIVDPGMYHDPTRADVSYNFDRLYAAGIPMKVTTHLGTNHGKLALLYGQGMTIFGSSNWTTPSGNSQHENNYFTTKSFIFNYFVNYFERRWNNSNPLGVAETGPFVPLPPDTPVYQSPTNGATGIATTSVSLRWYAGPWGEYYDIYFGTDPNPPLFAANRFLGPSTTTTDYKSFLLPTLTAGTTYYWKIVSRTAANLTKSGSVVSFTTAGTPPPPPPGATTVVLWTANVPGTDVHGDWTRIADSTAAGGAALQNPDRGRAKISPALASPTNYFDIGFNAVSGAGYHLWVRMRAQGNSTSNDSIHVQFSDSVDGVGTAVARIGTTTSFEPVLQDGPSGAAPHGWGWTDNGWGSLGVPVYFATTGAHVIRIQQREDGAIVDQIVLSPDTYTTAGPGPHYDDTTILPSNDGFSPTSTPPPSSGGTVVLWTANAAASDIHGNWLRISDSTAAGGAALRNPDAGAAKIAPALASPTNYFEMSFSANANAAYHVWVRLRADNNSTSNDSIHMQFSDSVDASNAPFARIGTTSSAELVLQNGPSGAAPHGWGWTDNGWGGLGPSVYFATTGTHTLRVQQREDGVTIDQIVISPDTYLSTSPGARLDDTTILPATGGSTPPPPPPPTATIVLWPNKTPAAQIHGAWQIGPDATAAGGSSIWNPDAGAAKIAPALASPVNYFEMTFTADAGKAYHVWIRMRAQNNSTSNDSVHMQFSDALDGSNAAYAAIGTTQSGEFVLQAGPTGASPHGWGWTDNGWGSLGPNIFFAASGTHTLRIQQREDGAVLDQIVISPDAYLTSAPGTRLDDTTILTATQ